MLSLPAKRALAAVLLLSLGACTTIHVSAVPVGERTFPARASDYPITVYDRAEDVGRPFVKIARLSANKYDHNWYPNQPTLSHLAEVLDDLKDKAREVGADAIVLRGRTEITSADAEGGKVLTKTSTGGDEGDVHVGHGVDAIRFVTPQPQSQPESRMTR